MILREYTKRRAELLYRLALPEITSPVNIKVHCFDVLTCDEVREKINRYTHAHKFHEVHLVLSGRIVYVCDGKTYTVSEGEGLFVSEKPHKFVECSDDLLKCALMFSVDKSSPVSNILKGEHKEKFTFSADIAENTDRILALAEDESIFAPSIICGRIAEIIYSAFLSAGVNVPAAESLSYDTRFVTASKLINKNVCIKGDEVARECYLSTKQLGRIFRQHTGMSLSEYIANAKLERAKDLLSKTSRSIKEIAYTLGFESESNFSSFFRRRSGDTPSAYRQNVRKTAKLK